MTQQMWVFLGILLYFLVAGYMIIPFGVNYHINQPPVFRSNMESGFVGLFMGLLWFIFLPVYLIGKIIDKKAFE